MEFGDIEDPESNVSRLLARTQHYRMHEELGTEPGVYYIWDQS
jgi:phenylacetyl-CoA:acceptor oxidoreductase subunit 1